MSRLDIVDISPSEMMLASLEPEALLAWCCAFCGMARSCTGLGVTVAGRRTPVLRHARGTGTYFVLDVFVVSVVGGGSGRGGVGQVLTVYEMARFLCLAPLGGGRRLL